MTHVPGNRSVQLPYSKAVSPSPRRAGQAESKQSVGQNAQAVRFAGSPLHNTITNAGQRFVNFSLPTFENITEVFIWGFLAQDVVAMWLPRIYALLTEGRKAYDPKDDPSAKNQPFGKQFRKYVKGNLEGLNWENFYEGTKREFATGPGLLMVPAGLFLLAGKLGNSAIKMPFAAVKGMGKGLAQHFEDNNALDAKSSKVYRKQVQDYIQSIFQDQGLVKHPDLKLEEWSKKWVDNFYEKNADTKKKVFSELSEQLTSRVRSFNREHRMEAYGRTGTGKDVRQLMEDAHPLHRTEATWISYEPKKLVDKLTDSDLISKKVNLEKASKRLRQMPVADVLRDLTRMEDMVKAVEQKAAESGTFSEAAQQTMQELVKKKFGMAIGATVITAAYLTKLAFWAQNHNTYQATRFLNEKTAQNQSSKHHAANAQSQCTSQAPAISAFSTKAGSTNGLQPAFSQGPIQKPLPFALPLQRPVASPFSLPTLNNPIAPIDPLAAERRNA